MTPEDRMTNWEMWAAEQERVLDDLNVAVLHLNKQVAALQKQCDSLRKAMDENLVKPLSEETPPPHY